jgi:hypothetical protein
MKKRLMYLEQAYSFKDDEGLTKLELFALEAMKAQLSNPFSMEKIIEGCEGNPTKIARCVAMNATGHATALVEVLDDLLEKHINEEE